MFPETIYMNNVPYDIKIVECCESGGEYCFGVTEGYEITLARKNNFGQDITPYNSWVVLWRFLFGYRFPKYGFSISDNQLNILAMLVVDLMLQNPRLIKDIPENIKIGGQKIEITFMEEYEPCETEDELEDEETEDMVYEAWFQRDIDEIRIFEYAEFERMYELLWHEIGHALADRLPEFKDTETEEIFCNIFSSIMMDLLLSNKYNIFAH